MIAIIVGLITIVALFHYYYSNTYNYWKKRGIPYYIKNSIYLESFRLFNKNFMDDAIEHYTAFHDKRAYGIFQFGQPQLLIRDPDLLREICIKSFENFTNHQDVIFRSDEMLGKNLFALKDKKWRDMRTILSPVFTGSKLRGLCELMSECGAQTADYYVQKIKQQNSDKPLKVDIFDTCTRFTNDVIASTAFGIKVNSMANKDNEFFTVGQKVTNFSQWRLWLFNLPLFVKELFNVKIFPEEVYKFFRQIVNETIKVRVEKNIVRQDMINLLMEARKEQIKRNETANGKSDNNLAANNVLSNDDITAQGVIFFVAGFTNVALAISMASYEMAINPEIQKKVYAEIKEALKTNNGKIDYDVIKQMKYLDMVLSETLRKWSPVVVVDRVCNKAFKIETPNDGVINVEPGMTLTIPISGLHHDPRYFPNPEKFDPERFSETNKSKMNPYAYVPFGLGPRICIANRFVMVETKILLFHILKTFEIVTTDETPIPMVLEKGAVIKPKGDKYGLAFKIRQ